MKKKRGNLRVLGLGAAAATAFSQATPASAGSLGQNVEPAKTEHCVTDILSIDEMARGAVSKVDCFDTYAEVLRVLGYEVTDEDVTPGGPTDPSAQDSRRAPRGSAANAARGIAVNAASFPVNKLATHFDDLLQNGSSLTVNGTNCDGGGISFGFGNSWNNRIRSTVHYKCHTIKHYPGSSYDGTAYQTTGYWGNPRSMDTTMDREASSIKYFEPVNN